MTCHGLPHAGNDYQVIRHAVLRFVCRFPDYTTDLTQRIKYHVKETEGQKIAPKAFGATRLMQLKEVSLMIVVPYRMHKLPAAQEAGGESSVNQVAAPALI
jgi:hypothetical protein